MIALGIVVVIAVVYVRAVGRARAAELEAMLAIGSTPTGGFSRRAMNQHTRRNQTMRKMPEVSA